MSESYTERIHGKLFKSFWYRSTYEYDYMLFDLTQRVKPGSHIPVVCRLAIVVSSSTK